MRDDAVDAKAPLLVFLVIGEIALEPFDMAVVFEGEHVGGDAIEEEAVVADDDCAGCRSDKSVSPVTDGLCGLLYFDALERPSEDASRYFTCILIIDGD